MLALERPVGGGGIDGAPPPPLLDAGLPPPLKLLVHDSAKPGRHAAGAAAVGAEREPELMGANQRAEFDLWVAHSTASYAAEHLKGADPPEPSPGPNPSSGPGPGPSPSPSPSPSPDPDPDPNRNPNPNPVPNDHWP